MPLCRGLGFQVTPSPRFVQCTLTGGNAQWSISSRTVLNFDLFSGTLFLDIGSVRQRNFTPDFEIKVLCDIFLLLSAITWCFSSLLSTRAYAQRFARFLKLCASSTMRESAPSSSKVTTSSRFGASSKFYSLVFNCFFLLSNCLTVRRLSLLSMLSNCISSSSICLRINSAFLASESGIFSNWL